MNILIIEDEIYLAQKVASRLQEDGYNTTHLSNIQDINFDIYYDTILLSTNLQGDYESLIKKYANSIIILLVTYVSESTVTNPIKSGANDYVLKPFMMDELIRKINHFEDFNSLEQTNSKMENYLSFAFQNKSKDMDIPKKLPFLIQTNDQNLANNIVYEVAKKLNLYIKFISFSQLSKIEISIQDDQLFYGYNFHTLKQSSKDIVLKACKDKNIILCSNEQEDIEINTIKVNTNNQISTIDSILTVNDYVKQITLNFQSKYPDTELSKRLGISRKSLWEKRKRFGIEKKQCNQK